MNGPTFPAAGDVDGDGRAELVIGVGTGGAGWLQVLDDATQNHASRRWLQVPWPAYNTARGETHAAVGDLDGDAQAEIAVGLGPYASAGGWLQVIDAGGATFPAVGRFR